MLITREHAERVLAAVDAGLVKGKGDPVPGKMCVEAAVCYALWQPHSDKPTCVNPMVREVKIALNDGGKWEDNPHRARGLRRVAVAQLGSAEPGFDEKVFCDAIEGSYERPATCWCRAKGCPMCFVQAFADRPDEGAKVVEDALRKAGSPGVKLLDEILGS